MQRTFVRIMSVIGVCLLAVGACRDLAISEVLYDPSSWLGILFQEGWPLLLKLLLALSFALLADRKHKFCYGAMLLCCLLFANDVRRLTHASVFSVAIIVGLTFSLLVCIGVSRWLSPWQKERLRPYLQLSSALFYRAAPHQRPQAGLGPCPLSTDGRSEPVLCLVSPLWCAGNFFSQRTYELVCGDRARRAVASLSTAAFACAPHRCGGRRQHPAHDALPGDHGRTFCQ